MQIHVLHSDLHGIRSVDGPEQHVRLDGRRGPWLSYLTGAVWIGIGIGIVAVGRRGITILALAIAVGIALIVGDALKVVATAPDGLREQAPVDYLNGSPTTR